MLYYHMIWRENKKYSELHKMHSSLDKVLYWVLFFFVFLGGAGVGGGGVFFNGSA